MWTAIFFFQFVLAQGFVHQKHYGGMRSVSMCKPLRSNSNDDQEKDFLLAKIAAKEAEFQAELDKLLSEARNNNDKEVEDFNDNDLAKAISEMQKLNKNKPKSSSSSSISDDEITNFLQKMSQQVNQLTNKQQQAIADADKESSFVRVVIPPGNNNQSTTLQQTYSPLNYSSSVSMFLLSKECVRGKPWWYNFATACLRLR